MSELITDEMVTEMTGHQALEPGPGFGGTVEWDCECGVTVHDGRQQDAWEPFARHQVEKMAPLIAGRALEMDAAKRLVVVGPASIWDADAGQMVPMVPTVMPTRKDRA